MRIATKISGKMRLKENSGSRLIDGFINFYSQVVDAGIVLNLIDLALLRGHGGVKLDFAECAFILVHVLLQNIQQGLGLLRA